MERQNPEWSALLKAIIQEPDEDTVRLAAADWLDENAGRVTLPCPRCGGEKEANAWMIVKPIGEPERKVPIGKQPCHLCENDYGDPTGFITVPNGFAERAEFIRIGCELAGGVPPHPQGHLVHGTGADTRLRIDPSVDCKRTDCRLCVLRTRERELLHGDDRSRASLWFDSPGFLVLNSLEDRIGLRFTNQERPGSGRILYDVYVRRGFIDEIRLPLRAFTEDAAREIFGRHPVTKVGLTDREPARDPNPGFFWSWLDRRADDTDVAVERHRVPLHLWRSDYLTSEVIGGGRHCRWFDTPAAALEALSRACVDWGRSLVRPKLPPLAWPQPAGTGV